MSTTLPGWGTVHVHPPQFWHKCPGCGTRFHGAEHSICLGCKIAASRDAGFWRSVAAEDRIDNRDARTNDRAERAEIRERDDEEWAARQGKVITEGADV